MMLLFALLATTHALKTVYESETISPQNADYDASNKMFPAHSGWLNDKLIHYYKFRMHTPGTYPNLFAAKKDLVAINKIFVLTTTDQLADMVPEQMPILWKHHQDGEEYSDFCEIVAVTVPEGYVAGMAKSASDVDAWAQSSMGYANVPLVPTGSSLENPAALGTKAPISPWPVLYDGIEVHTYVFEVSSDKLKGFFDKTRASANKDFDVSVVPDLVSDNAVFRIPLWHMNQYWDGVETGVNNGGPNPKGQRNIIAADRGDAGYSPLWILKWVTRVPINYEPDQASHANVLTAANGFEIADTPMIVNCPNVGAVGAVNPKAKKTFALPVFGPTDDVNIQGALIMRGDQTINAISGKDTIGTVKTNGMGGFTIKIKGKDAKGLVKIIHEDETTDLASYSFETTAVPSPGTTEPSPGATESSLGTTQPSAGATEPPADSDSSSALAWTQFSFFAALIMIA